MTSRRQGRIAALLEHPGLIRPHAQCWADLGCGEGAFTVALAGRLAAGSTIHAVDADRTALAALPSSRNGVGIATHHADFTAALPATDLDGILLANALHYVQRQADFLARAAAALADDGALVIIEYETDRPNRWVPYPLPRAALAPLLARIDFSILSTRTQPSRYQSGGMYSVLAR